MASTTVQQAVDVITGNGIPAPLLARVPDLVGNAPSDHPQLTTSESNTMLQAAVRVGMQQRPQHFSPLESGAPVSSDTPFDIAANFLREFTQGGALDALLPGIRQSAEENIPDASQRSAGLEFMNGLAGILKWVGSDDVHNPEKNPLNKYVTPGDIDRAIELETWLEKNRGHEDYDAAQRQFMELDRRIKTARSQAMEEGGQYVFSLLKRMDPSLAGMENPSDIIAHKEKEWAETERQEFENYVLTEFGKSDIFEPNLLRSFWEKIERNQYGKVFYRIVCESFAAHQDSPLHQKVQQIWLASHLDTIHHQPQEARHGCRQPPLMAFLDQILATEWKGQRPIKDG